MGMTQRKKSLRKGTSKRASQTSNKTLYPVGKIKQISKFFGYDAVLLVDPFTRHATQIGGNVQFPEDLYTHTLHNQALAQTLKQGMFHYEWSMPTGKTHRLYQTTCVALIPPGGKGGCVLSFSRDITQQTLPFLAPSALHDVTSPRTFAQILLSTREAEKKEISKALHDEIGSSAVMLTALLSLVRASVQAGNAQQALRDLEQMDVQFKESVERLKGVIVSLRPPSLENKGGLGGAVRDLLENISALSHIPFTFDYDQVDQHVHLSDNVKILLYRIVQEAVTNTVKHAHAKRIRVSLKKKRDDILLIVADDGVGFKPTQQLSIEHVGLLAMKDSVELLGGKIAIKSAPGKGTRIEVVCPFIVYGGKE